MLSIQEFKTMSVSTKSLNSTQVRQDAELLNRFVQDRDATAFRQIVERHASLVLGICHRVLKQKQDAEDACQAVFLILARKANAILKRESVTSWLYGVAYRTASNLRRAELRRKKTETTAIQQSDITTMCEGEPISRPPHGLDAESLSDLRRILDEELARMPDELRAPLALCYFEGRARDEAAAMLGWSLSTLKGRLSRARDLLQSRLKKRGLVLSVALLGAVFSQEAAAAVSGPLVTQVTLAAPYYLAGQALPAGSVNLHAVQMAGQSLATMGLIQVKLAAMFSVTAALVVTSSCLAWQTLATPARADFVRADAVTQQPDPVPQLQAPQSAVVAKADARPAEPAEEISQPKLVSDVTAKTAIVPLSTETAPTVIALNNSDKEDSEPAEPEDVTTEKKAVPTTAFKNVSAGEPKDSKLPSTKVDGYTIRVQRAARIEDVDVDLLPTGKPFLPEGPITEKTLVSPNGNAFGQVAAGGGGWAGVTKKPRVVIDLKVDAPANDKRKVIVEVSPRASGIDDLRQPLASSDFPAALGWQLRNPNGTGLDGQDMIFLLPKNSAHSESIRELQGELLITEGEVTSFPFDQKALQSKSKKGVTKKSHGHSMTLSAIRRNADGIEVDLTFEVPPLPGGGFNQNPGQRLMQLIQSQPEISGELRDKDGIQIRSRGTQAAFAMANGFGQGGQGGFGIGGQGGAAGGAGGAGGGFGGGAGGQGGAGGGAGGQGGAGGAGGVGGGFGGGAGGQGGQFKFAQNSRGSNVTLRFEALAEGAEIDSLLVSLTRRTGATERLAFKLRDIPVLELAEPAKDIQP